VAGKKKVKESKAKSSGGQGKKKEEAWTDLPFHGWGGGGSRLRQFLKQKEEAHQLEKLSQKSGGR